MTEADIRLAELCRNSVSKSWLRICAQALSLVAAAVHIDLWVGLIFGGQLLIAECGYTYRVWRAQKNWQSERAFQKWDRILIYANGAHVVLAITAFSTAAAIAEAPGYHLPSFALTFSSILYVSIFEHQVRNFLVIRVGLLGAAILPIGFWDIITSTTAVGPSLWMQLIVCCIVLVFCLDCTRGMVRLYDQRREEIIQLANAKARAEQLTQEKSSMISTMSHELRTPLNGIMGMAELISLGGDYGAETGKKLEVLRASARRLNTLLTDVLDTEKLMADRMDILPVEVSPTEMLKESVDQHRGSAETKGLSLFLNLPRAGLVPCMIDPVRVTQCLANLLTNAIKFTSEGTITITARHSPYPQPGMLTITVEDMGIGMTRQQMDNLFSQFAQADETISRRYGGTGLGLWISRNLARQMGGDLVVSSVPEEGSVFTLTILAPPSSAAEEPAIDALKGLQILNVEDVAVNRQIVRMMLSRFDIALTEAESAEEALELLSHGDFDVILTDGNLPGMSGADFVQTLRGSGRPSATAPIVCVSADSTFSDPEKRAQIGLSGFVPKPFDERTLLAALTRAQADKDARRAA